MNVAEATVTSKGQITIPKAIRERFDIEEGSTVVFNEEDGELKLEPRYANPREELKRMRQEIRFAQDEIEQIQEASREHWQRDLPG